ncbi:MAG TPA: ABC transporter permease [Gemmatimonadales bacterium]|nr:ABC transporter permease [Gemmatimonadales bacterium]
MHKVWAVIRREFVERVRTKAFVVGTVLGPMLMAFFIVLPILLESRDTRPRRIAVVDAASGAFARRVEGALSAARTGLRQPRPRYEVIVVPAHGRLAEVRDSLVALTGVARGGARGLDGVLLVTDEALEGGEVEYLGTNVGSLSDMEILATTIQQTVVAERLERAQVDPDVVRHATGRVRLSTAKVTEGRLTGESGEASFLLAYVMAFVLYISLVLYGIQVMTSVLEEKSNRIVEVLVSSLTPFQLMLGKVVGVAAVGLLQLGIWAGTAVLLTTQRTAIAGLFNVPPEAVSVLPIPTIRADLLVVFLLFFVLGFLLYAALYAAVGAMCNTMQETQQLNTPITLLVATGFICMFALLKDPNGTLAKVLSLIPFFAPTITPVRYSLHPIPLPELLLSIGVTAAGMLAITWLASRIFRVGILMYGKRPTLREVARWVRAA